MSKFTGLTLNKSQVEFMRDEAMAWIDVQKSDHRFEADALRNEEPGYLFDVARMFTTLGGIRSIPEGGSMLIDSNSAYSLLCYVEDEETFEQYIADGEISREDITDYRNQLEAAA